MSLKRQKNIWHKLAKKIEGLVKDDVEQEEEKVTTPLAEANQHPQEVKSVILQAAQDMNFGIVSDEDNSDGTVSRIFFKYQSAAFLLDLYKSNPCRIQLTFPSFMGIQADMINEVRAACNHFNNNCLSCFCTYDMDKEENELNISLLNNLRPTLSVEEMKEELQDCISGFFSMSRHYSEHFQEIAKTKKKEKIEDLEYEFLCNKRLDALLAEDELQHQFIREGDYESPTLSSKEQCQLGVWLKRCHLLLGNVTLDQLTVQNDQGYTETVTSEENIRNFFLLSPILGQTEKAEEVSVQNATLSLTYHHATNNEEQPSKRKVMMILLENAACIDHTLYVRVSYLLPERKANNTTRLESHVYTNHTSGNMVIGYDWKNEGNKQSEFEYMWQEAQDKLGGINTDSLTPEQEVLLNVTHPALGFCCYWGKKFLLCKRFYEATYYLEIAWNMQNNYYYKLDRKGHALYDELCFELSLCYNKLGYPQMALFYINNIEEMAYNRYIKEETNAMIAARQHDTVPWIEKGLENLRERIDEMQYNEQDVDADTADLYRFLRRQYVTSCIEVQQFMKAEDECKRMIEENEMVNFAQSELNYINQLREKGVTDKI